MKAKAKTSLQVGITMLAAIAAAAVTWMNIFGEHDQPNKKEGK